MIQLETRWEREPGEKRHQMREEAMGREVRRDDM